ncbi:citramalate synthase [Oceanicella actignis]|uniref:Citramalate synthase n=1 Tax=Oceanicella actignis TaxID=1189325 RepID=A0A1M7RUC5_9RHOB|nr:citramalate synthase [Oceanicella actignis]SET03474.1 2-isopropylmalate synthase [Oceanicella actignis]SHN49810.1 2-isopropylmalate synthase [Oceanicella actignis]
MTARERLFLYDTTLRDGQQTAGVDFSAEEKARIARALDALGVDYVEGGWPGANPTDSDFFDAPPSLSRARLTAFGMTRRVGRSAANDDVLGAVINAGAPAVCLVGKTHDYHVTAALGVSLDENRQAIADSLRHLVALGREALFDAEHFFDGYKANPDYALSCVEAAIEAGARWVVLCDTNGGALPHEVFEITQEVTRRFPGERIGIHCHDDAGLAAANSLAAVDAGARQIQGTLNGLGERCGNANLVTLIPTLLLKAPYRDRFETGVTPEALTTLTSVSRMVDDILNRVPDRHAPYVGAAAFTHKAGLHASAILKDPSTYEHIPPELVGNERVVPMSNQAGQSNLIRRLSEMGIKVEKGDPRLARILDLVKRREDEGYAYDGAQASFELLARRELGLLPRFFEVERYRVTVERRRNALQREITVSEAVVVVRIDGERVMSVSESHDPVSDADQGPVNALSRALAKDLGRYQSYIDDMHLVDFKVRITGAGTDAVTRVLIDSADGQGRRWSTVGVSANIVDASFQALHDALVWKLVRDGAPAAA